MNEWGLVVVGLVAMVSLRFLLRSCNAKRADERARREMSRRYGGLWE